MKFLRIHDIETMTGISRSTIHRLIKKGDFPRSTCVGRRCIVWMESDVEEWLRTTAQQANTARSGGAK
jgi:prophage regulatory protein